MVKHVEMGVTFLGEPAQLRRSLFVGGHAYRRGIVQYLVAAGVEVWDAQALLRHSSSAIVRYLDKSLSGTSSRFAEEVALGGTLKTIRSEIRALSAQLETRKADASQLLVSNRQAPQTSQVVLTMSYLSRQQQIGPLPQPPNQSTPRQMGLPAYRHLGRILT
jgi:hypothetical protein